MTINLILNNKPNRKGLHCIFIRVTHKRRHHATSSEIYVKESEFDKKAEYGKWIIKHLDRSALNEALKRKVVAIERTYQLAEDVSPEKALIADNFFKFGYDFIEKYNNDDQYGTYEQYKAKLTKLKAYAGVKLKFSEITPKFIRDYVNHLRKPPISNSVNGLSVDLRKIRAIIRQAKRDRIVSENPFDNISIEVQKTRKEKLTVEELQAIRDVSLEPTEYKFHARNVFLLQLNLMGERVGAILKIKSSQIANKEIHYQADKGGKSKNIELTEEARSIIDLYPDRGKYLFPYLEDCDNVRKKIKSTTTMINDALKDIAEMAGIDKRITTHVSRHSFTKLALDAKVDIRTIQGMFKHSSIKITEDYAGEIADSDGNEALKKIFKK